MALSSQFEFSITSNLTKTSDFGAPASQFSYQKLLALATGTGAGQADVMWGDTRLVTTGATDSIDLVNATFADAFGVAITIAKVKAVALYSYAANTTTLDVTRPAANGVAIFQAAADACRVYAGGWFFWFAGSGNNGATVTAGTADLIDIVNSAGASATYDIFIAGTSA